MGVVKMQPLYYQTIKYYFKMKKETSVKSFNEQKGQSMSAGGKEIVPHPLFDARMLYTLLELEVSLDTLVKQHEEEGYSTFPYDGMLGNVRLNILRTKELVNIDK